MKNPIKMDDLGVPLFFGNTHMYCVDINHGTQAPTAPVTPVACSWALRDRKGGVSGTTPGRETLSPKRRCKRRVISWLVMNRSPTCFGGANSRHFSGWWKGVLLHPGKLTWQWNRDHLKMNLLLKMGLFHCYVSLPEGILALFYLKLFKTAEKESIVRHVMMCASLGCGIYISWRWPVSSYLRENCGALCKLCVKTSCVKTSLSPSVSPWNG